MARGALYTNLATATDNEKFCLKLQQKRGEREREGVVYNLDFNVPMGGAGETRDGV